MISRCIRFGLLNFVCLIFFRLTQSQSIVDGPYIKGRDFSDVSKMHNHFSCLEKTIIYILFFLNCQGSQAQAEEFSLQAERQFRADRETWMKSASSPLALAGLYWLRAGANSFGTGSQNMIVLPAGTAREHVGEFILQEKKVILRVRSSEAKVTIKGVPATNRSLRSDAGGGPADLLEVGDLRMKIIQRGDRLGIRLIYLKNASLSSFLHLSFFEPSPRFRVEADFLPYAQPKRIKIVSVIGVEEEMPCPGLVRFQLDGQEYSLEPIAEPGEPLFFIFKDRTNGKETYGGGRFLNAAPPINGKVILNFNRATNPYCAYSSYATCPMPPIQNWLKTRIPAGEKKYSPSPH